MQCKDAISVEKGQELIKQKFDATTIKFVQKVQNKGLTYVYDVQTKDGDGRVVLACDGRLAEYELTPNQACKYNIDSNQAIAVAQDFCKKHSKTTVSLTNGELQDVGSIFFIGD